MHTTRRGFTIVELLIVIIVIAILTSIAILSFIAIQAQTRDSKRASDMDIFNLASERFFTKNGEYVSSPGIAGNTNTAASISDTTTIAQLRQIDGEISTDFKDPSNKATIFRTTNPAPGYYFYLGGWTVPVGSTTGVSITRTFSLPDSSLFSCTYNSPSLTAGATTSYVFGYYSEAAKAYVFRHGKSGLRWVVSAGSDIRCKNFVN